MASADSNDLRSRLEGLAAESGFAIRGLELIRPEPARDEQGSVPDRLSSVLRDYNYALIHDGRGQPISGSLPAKPVGGLVVGLRPNFCAISR